MAKIIRREVRRRGFFGWIFLLIFLAFNALMLAWVITSGTMINALPPSSGSADYAGRLIGSAVGFGAIIFVWTAGAVITGLFALLTRGRKTYIEETVLD